MLVRKFLKAQEAQVQRIWYIAAKMFKCLPSKGFSNQLMLYLFHIVFFNYILKSLMLICSALKRLSIFCFR
jgi:hypothetical protein